MYLNNKISPDETNGKNKVDDNDLLEAVLLRSIEESVGLILAIGTE